MKNEHIKTVLKKHGIDCHITTDKRIIAHDMLSDGRIQEKDLTGYGLNALMQWLGY